MNWRALGKAILDLILISFFTMLASLMTLLSMVIKSDNPFNWVSIYNNGNFFLYSISLLSSSLVYYIHKKDHQFAKFFVIIIIVVCAMTYSQFVNNNTSNTNFTKYFSIFSLIVSFYFFANSQYYQHIDVLDLNLEGRNNQKQLADQIKFN